MPFKNLTPLHCLPFEALTPAGEPLAVVIVKTTLDLVPADGDLRARGFTHWLKLSQDQQPVALTDAYHGAFLESSVRWESETAPLKPRCDVIVLGSAHAPGARPRRRFPVAVQVQTPPRARPLPPRPPPLGFGVDVPPEFLQGWRAEVARAQANPIPGTILIHKRLQVTGERWLKRRNLLARLFWGLVKLASLGLIRRCPWVLTWPKALTVLPLMYEYAFGGHRQLRASDPGAWRMPRRNCLPGVDKAQLRRAWKQTQTDGLLAAQGWDWNYVGRGFAPAWYLKAARVKRLPAPQVEDPKQPFSAKAAWKAMTGKATGRFLAALMPQGLGALTRNWQPRLNFAGTWDAAWAQSGAPYPPDHDLAFNNQAHPDLQCRHLAGDEIIELTNLCAPTLPGVAQDPQNNQFLRFSLPGHTVYLLLFPPNASPVPCPAVLDTLILEPDTLRVTLLHRAHPPHSPTPLRTELRLTLANP